MRAICRTLPETREQPAWTGVRWTIRKQSFAHLVHIEDGWPPAYARAAGSDGPLTVLTVRASGMLFETLRTTGGPYFAPVWGTRWEPKVIGRKLTGRFDRDEIAVIITESYRLVAPRKLAAQVPATE